MWKNFLASSCRLLNVHMHETQSLPLVAHEFAGEDALLDEAEAAEVSATFPLFNPAGYKQPTCIF